MYDFNSKFDIEKHKKTYINYLEVVIFPDGTIEYAVPSHQEKLIAVCCKMFDVDRDGLGQMCPKEYYFDFMTWLCKVSHCVSVWNKYVVKPDIMTKEQKEALLKLKLEGLYTGEL